MSRIPDLASDDDLDLSLETLDQWESELDQFAAGVMRRLSNLTGKAVDMRGLVPQSEQELVNDQGARDTDDGSEAMQVLKSLRELTQ